MSINAVSSATAAAAAAAPVTRPPAPPAQPNTQPGSHAGSPSVQSHSQPRPQRTERPYEPERIPAATVYQATPPKPAANQTGKTVGTIINVTA